MTTITNWPDKAPAENFQVQFDFTKLDAAVTSASVVVDLVSGTDATPEAILSGTANVAAGIAYQRLNAGQPGCRYLFTCAATDGTNTYQLTTTLTVDHTSLDSVSIIDYTSYDEVRAALGVSEEEVGDTVLALPMYGSHLDAELQELADTLQLSEDIAETASTISAVAPASRTKMQKRLLSSLSLFATYAVARHLGTSLPMMAPKAIMDGKAGVTRFSDGPYKSTLLSIEAQYERAKGALSGILSALNSTTISDVPLVYFSVSSPAIDPVTGS